MCWIRRPLRQKIKLLTNSLESATTFSFRNFSLCDLCSSSSASCLRCSSNSLSISSLVAACWMLISLLILKKKRVEKYSYDEKGHTMREVVFLNKWRVKKIPLLLLFQKFVSRVKKIKFSRAHFGATSFLLKIGGKRHAEKVNSRQNHAIVMINLKLSKQP